MAAPGSILDCYPTFQHDFIFAQSPISKLDQLQSAEHGKQGLTKVAEYLPSLIITDLAMPEMDEEAILNLVNKSLA